jgi:hypothetical protein
MKRIIVILALGSISVALEAMILPSRTYNTSRTPTEQARTTLLRDQQPLSPLNTQEETVPRTF